MPRQIIAFFLCALAASFIGPTRANAEMGSCRRDGDWITCGSGNGAARVVEKTMSPSGGLAFAWRLTDRAPGNVPHENDPYLENFIVRITDGAVLAKSRGSYWDLGSKIAHVFLFTAWSPDSRLLIKVEQHVGFASAELFSFDQKDKAIGPFELVNVIKPAVLAQMKSNKDTGAYALAFSSHPAMTIDNQGLIHLRAQAVTGGDSPVYEVTLQVSGIENSLTASVNSIVPYPKASIFITVQ